MGTGAPPAISHGWRPETGYLRFDWRGYNEAILVYILALGSPTFAVEDEAWDAWTQTYKNYWGTFSGQEHLSFGPHVRSSVFARVGRFSRHPR